MNWKKSLIFCVSFFATFFGEIAINIACGPEQDPYDYYISFFHNNVQGDQYMPFAFNGLLYLNSEEDVTDEKNVNSAEWAKYLNIAARDVYKVMYELDSATDAKLKRNSYKWSSNLPESLKKNTFLIALSKYSAALKYFQQVKKCEPMISKVSDWDNVKADTTFLTKIANGNISIIEKTTDSFLKLRYAYQTQRLYRYSGDFKNSQAVYEKYIDKMSSTSAAKGWSLAQYAGLKRAEGDSVKAAYLFSKVFASNPERQIVAYRNYFWTNASISDVLKLAKNDTEKAYIYAINGFHQPDSDIQYLKEVYECNANSPLVAQLLIREVNKLEQNLIERSKMAQDYFSAQTDARYIGYNYFDTNLDSLRKANFKHLNVLRKFAVKLTEDKKYTQPEFGNIIAGYLSWIENNDALAIDFLKKVNPNALSPRLLDQYRITELLVRTNEIQKGVNNEVQLLPALKWLDEKRFAENKLEPKKEEYDYNWEEGKTKRFTVTARNFYQQILAPAYAKVGDTAKAALAMLKGDLKYKFPDQNTLERMLSYQSTIFWKQGLSEKNLAILARYRRSKIDTGMNAFLGKAVKNLKSDFFYELLGTSYLRAHQYANAISAFEKLSKNHKFYTPEFTRWDDNGTSHNYRIYANPFTETLKDYPKKYSRKPNGMNKKLFAVEMLRLEKLAASDKKNAGSYYYQMANALYQTGEFGNSWFLISYDWRVFVDKERSKYDYNSDYKSAFKAKEYYAKARILSTTANFKAKCTFMMARCEQKLIQQKYDAVVWNDTDDYEKQRNEQDALFKKMNANNPYFSELYKNYRAEKFYNTAVGECSVLRDFLKTR